MNLAKYKKIFYVFGAVLLTLIAYQFINKQQSELKVSSVAESTHVTNDAAKAVFDKIIFVTIDTLRQDHLKNYGYFRETSPFISSLIKDSAVFNNAFSASSHTAPSHASMFTALFPYEHKVLRNYDTLSPEIFNLSKLVSTQGYEQVAISAVKFLEGNVGFPVIESEIDLPSAEFSREAWYRNAAVNVDRSINWLEKKAHPERFFMWLHFYDVHEWDNLRNLPAEYHEIYNADNTQNVVDFVTKEHNIPLSFHGSPEKLFRSINNYNARLRFVDDQIKRLFEYVDKHDQNKNTLWIITSDHGEGLGSHNYKGHGEFLYQEQLKIPLIFYSTNKKIKAREISELVRTVDFLPTLMDLTGFSGEMPNFQGLSLKPLLDTGKWADLSVRYSFAERRPKDSAPLRRNWEEGEIFSLNDLDEKFIYHSESSNEFYDLKKDPFEERNLGQGIKQLKDNFRAKVLQMQEFYKSGQLDLPEQKLNKEQYEELKTLGYM